MNKKIVASSWTQTDVDVSCQQLGFQTGNFSFVSWATNDTSYMLYHKPSCTGQEQNIMDCPGSKSIKIGSRICSMYLCLSSSKELIILQRLVYQRFAV